MIETILHYKWSVLLVCEIIAWALLLPAAYFRYWTPSTFLCVLFVILSGILGYFPDIIIPILMCVKAGNVSGLYNSLDSLLYDAIVILIIIFEIKLGKKYAHRMDRWLYTKAQEKKNKQLNEKALLK